MHSRLFESVLLVPMDPLNSLPAKWVAAPTPPDATGIGLGISDELGNRFGRNRWIYYHDEGEADDAGDWRDVTEKNALIAFAELTTSSV